uniref:Apoptogenic protein 1, mitochondrial n=1 Tax=Callorhinchus milii TaxID=7868 RepID=V9L5I4_CALMI
MLAGKLPGTGGPARLRLLASERLSAGKTVPHSRVKAGGNCCCCCCRPETLLGKCYSTAARGPERPREADEKVSSFKPPVDSHFDWIGPPDRVSNLRPIKFYVPKNETKLEQRLRKMRQETQYWNQHFWSNQNLTFNKEKDQFVQSRLQAKGMELRDEDGRKNTLGAEEMAEFYKNFLSKNHKKHENYNKEWYRRNFTITWWMGQVFLQRAWRKLRWRKETR